MNKYTEQLLWDDHAYINEDKQTDADLERYLEEHRLQFRAEWFEYLEKFYE